MGRKSKVFFKHVPDDIDDLAYVSQGISKAAYEESFRKVQKTSCALTKRHITWFMRHNPNLRKIVDLGVSIPNEINVDDPMPERQNAPQE